MPDMQSKSVFKETVQRALLICLLVGSFAWSATRDVQGDVRTTNLSDLAPHPKNNDYYNEFWTYRFFLNDGMNLVVNFSRANLSSLKDPVCGANVSLTGFKGSGSKTQNFKVAREYPKHKFIWDPSRARLNVHEKIWFEGALPGAHKVRFETSKDGVDYFIDLNFTKIASSRVAGDGEYKVGSDILGMVLHIPWAKVEGIVAINGDTVKVSGTAVMDHTWQTNTAPRIVSHGFRYLTFFEGGYETGYFLLPADKGNRNIFPGYAIRKENGNTTLIQPQSLDVLEQKKKGSVPHWIRKANISMRNGETRNFVFKAHYDSHSMLSEFSGLLKWTVKKFFGGDVVTYRGWGEVDGNSAFYETLYVID